MRVRRRLLCSCGIASLAVAIGWACGFDDTLREYLSVQFWLPMVKHGRDLADAKVPRMDAPYAGMVKAAGATPLEKLRRAYQLVAWPDAPDGDPAAVRKALAVVRSGPALSKKEQEEVALIDAKVDIRTSSPEHPEALASAKSKLLAFLRTVRTPEYRSEARGWLAHVHYRLGEQLQAGKIYLDELNRARSNLSQETLLNSLRMTYGYDGGERLEKDLDQYFDTPEHAAFAIQLITNPRWRRLGHGRDGSDPEPSMIVPPYARITQLLEKHGQLFRSAKGAETLAMLGMRAALHGGDAAAAVRMATDVPEGASIRNDADFQWMLASAHFLSRDYAGAEKALLRMLRSARSTADQKAAAAYGLCGVYQKTGNVVEQIRMALWLGTEARRNDRYLASPSEVEDMTVYWAVSGWDLGLLLDAEASTAELQAFVDKYGGVEDARRVKYALAVHLARDERYTDSAAIYASIGAQRRAARMRKLAALAAEVEQGAAKDEARYRLAEFLATNPERVYFNDSLWGGLQRYALWADEESRVTREERERLLREERALKDGQEERWRAYLLLRELGGETPLGRRSAALAVRCLRGISTERFGRAEEIRKAEVELSRRLRAPR